jgi:hypothetical protein
MNERLPSQKYEVTIRAAMTMPDPRPQFLAELGEELDAKARQMAKQQARPQTRFEMFRRRSWQIGFALLLLAILAILAIGPQRVLAQVQHWLGYVPGIGFVEMEQTRVLVAPVDVQQEGVTLRIEQAVAEPGRTLVVISSEGLPPESPDLPSSRLDTLPKPVLRIPDGSVLEVVRQDLNYGGGKMEFPALPEGIYELTFEIDRLPLLPAGASPEGWQAHLVLRPATGELPEELFPQPYTPPRAEVMVNGVTARILQVAQSSEETALRVQFKWQNPDWELDNAGYTYELKDDQGNTYQSYNPYGQVASARVQEVETSPSPTAPTESAVPSSQETIRFPALPLSAQRAVLKLPSLEFSVPITTSFTFDPGSNPQLGQTWELDQQFRVAGVPLHLTGARVIQDDHRLPDERGLYGFEFTFRSPTDLDRTVSTFFLGTDFKSYRGGGGGMRQPGVYKIEMLFKQLPQEPMRITFDQVWVMLFGPWEIGWEIP